MPILTLAIPSYNAQHYLQYCVESLAIGKDVVEILIINDGSTDNTQIIAKKLEQTYSNVRLINQENKGHGGAVNTGLQHATGTYFKVVDSDDWVDTKAYLKILDTLQQLQENDGVDALVTNFVYEKEGATRKKVMSYASVFKENKVLSWDDIQPFKTGQYLMMHSLIFKTELLRTAQLQLPEHTFYVDNIYVFMPLQHVKSLYYMNVDFYRYFIGRDDQSVNEKVMIARIDQQIKVNKYLIDHFDMAKPLPKWLKHYLLNHIEITTVISSALLNKANTTMHYDKKCELWHYMKTTNPELYSVIRKRLLAQMTVLPTRLGRMVSNAIYHVTQKVFGFN